MHRRNATGRRGPAVLAAVILASVATTAARAAPTAVTEYGTVRGNVAEGMDEFLGIRYAAPPVGALRWQPPQPLARALFSHAATRFGPHCAQIATPFGTASTAEDCLYLNVYTPAGPRPADARPLPVMVWIHGGSLATGESDDYDPVKLVTAGHVIVVTINYRLGYLGFLAESGLDAEGHAAANYGLQDQQFALDWVRRNIAGFGGDAGRVTMAGESSGGLSVLSNLVSPGAYGLFNRAIAESGAYALTLPTLATAETAGNALAAQLGCAAADTACLRAQPASAFLGLLTVATSLTPVVDGTTVPLSLGTAFSTGRFNRVPLLVGSNHDEDRLFVTADAALTAAEYPAALDATYGATLGPVVTAEYPVGDYPQPVLAFAANLTDGIFSCPTRQLDRWTARYVPTYAYEFNDENAPEYSLPPTTYPYGAAHAIELQFLFEKPTPRLPGTPPLTAAEERLSETMVRYWTNFVSTSSPDRGSVPEWQPYAPGADVFQSLVPPRPAPEGDFASAHKCAFWSAVTDASVP